MTATKVEATKVSSDRFDTTIPDGYQKMNADELMQMMGGIGYTEVYPIERALRDSRLAMIWTGTSQIMNLLIQHEYYNEILNPAYDSRKMEKNDRHPDESERCFTDEDMWEVHEKTS